MTLKERHTALLEYLTEHGKTEVATLADYLNTSKVTIRKDLDTLSERGIIKRERGYALLKDPDDINYRMAFHYDNKQRIAHAAASLVQDGETLIIESGSTCALFAEELAKHKQNITIITNSVYLADYVADYNTVEIILLGGTLQPKGRSLVGPLTKQAIQNFHVDKIFAGTDGFSRDFGFTGEDLIRTDTLREMIKSATHTYILADSTKFRQAGAVAYLRCPDVNQLITDSGILDEDYKYLNEQGIHILIAE